MFKKIADLIPYDTWVKIDPRYRRLDIYDRLLDGVFYEHLPYAFYDETTQTGQYIPLAQRRPSVQYGMPQLIAKTVARKLFAGRHRPLFINASDLTLSIVNKFLVKANIYEKMLQAVNWGSVGSVAITFSFVNNQLRLDIWRAKWCQPTFDECHCLEKLRIFYLVPGISLIRTGQLRDFSGEEISARDKYWWIRDFTSMQEVTYKPIPEKEWNPVDGEPAKLVVPDDGVVNHELGFVPGEWLVNLSGGVFPDGSCTWDSAIPNAIEIDYTLSQLGRGVRYNASPEVVIQGELENYESEAGGGTIIRGPVNYLKFKSTIKDHEGVTVNGGDAKLLEMTGQGIEAGLNYVDKIRKYSLETLTAIRKDPEQMKGPLSGRAMELVDEEFLDMVFELQTAYGDNGLLALIKKILKTTNKTGIIKVPDDYEEMTLHWPRAYTPVPAEMVQIVQAFAQITDPENPLLTDKAELQDHLRAQLDLPLARGTEKKVELPEEEKKEAAPIPVGQPTSGRPIPPDVDSITDESQDGGTPQIRIDA